MLNSKILITLALGGWVAYSSVFTVGETEKAIKFQLGEMVKADYAPGLHVKIPLYNNVKKFDARIQTLFLDPEQFLTSEKKNLVVDSFVKWQVQDVGKFYTNVGGDALQLKPRLEQIIYSGMRDEFSKHTIREVVSSERGQIREILLQSTKLEAEKLGVAIIDIRVMRVELPSEVSSSVYRRMESERARVAREFRSRGAEAAERIRADADRQREVLQADAYREAEKTRGEGDAAAAEIYAGAYGKNPEFSAFYRSLAAYARTFRNKDATVVLEPDSDFFRYFKREKEK